MVNFDAQLNRGNVMALAVEEEERAEVEALMGKRHEGRPESGS